MNSYNCHMMRTLHSLMVLTLSAIIAFSSIAFVNAESITITKEWNDGLTGTDAANRVPPKVTINATLTKEEMLNLMYPVGCYYETSNSSFNPNEAWGGTWVEDDAGQAHVAAGTANGVTYTTGATGGNKDAIVVSHSHTVDSHTHSIPKLSGTAASNGAHTHVPSAPSNSDAGFCAMRMISGRSGIYELPWGSSGYGFASNSGWADVSVNRNTSSAGAHTHSVTTNAGTTGGSSPETNTVGSSGTNANMQPYKVVRRWHRTA